MLNSVLLKLKESGQSIWIDYISRSLIEHGALQNMIDSGLLGMTSNPTIFEQALSSGIEYDLAISSLAYTGKSTFEIYDDLTVKDVQDAADMFMPVYDKTDGLDGYVSLEVNPKLAYDTGESIKEARRLYQKVNRANVMFKIPSTPQGIEAIEELVSSGININATLIFSLKQYADVAQAYIKGISRLVKSRKDVSRVSSVASIFVSRIDTKVDKELDEILPNIIQSANKEKIDSLRGKAAVANCSLIYEKFQGILSEPSFKKLENKGANIQRVLWASTSTKNPSYSDIKYVSELIKRIQ